MAFLSWARLSREQRKVWSFVTGAIVVGSVFKVAYFTFSRRLVVNDSDKQQQERLGHLREAGEFAEWSRRDRESRLPPLTDEQREQMQQYLRLVEQHGLRRIAEHRRRASGDGSNDGADVDDDDCVGCPAFRHVTRKSTKVSPEPARGRNDRESTSR